MNAFVALFSLIVVPTSGKLKVRSIKTNILIKTAQFAKLAQLDIAQKEIHLKNCVVSSLK